MKQLQKEFIGKGEVKGFKFRLISKADRAYLYEVDTGNTKYYEVFRKVINRRFACVSYPTSNSFGIWSWNCKSLVEAYKKFEKLNKLNHD